MSSSLCYGWQNLPGPIIEDIMMMMMTGSESFRYFSKVKINFTDRPDSQVKEPLKCRQVCRNWNVMISQMTKQKKDTIRGKATGVASKVREWLTSGPFLDYISLIKSAALLAHHGMLGSLENIWLRSMTLASVPADHLASLVSSVTGTVRISFVICHQGGLIPLLNSIKCDTLHISSQTLGREETQALVRAMESNVKWLEMGYGGSVHLDIKALTQYTGEGRCEQVELWGDTGNRYMTEVERWAKMSNRGINPLQENISCHFGNNIEKREGTGSWRSINTFMGVTLIRKNSTHHYWSRVDFESS